MTASTTAAPVHDYAAARKAMLDSQLRTSGVNEEFVLARMGTLPREDFVPTGARAAAYIDRAVPLGNGRWLASPLVHARTLAEAQPKIDDRALVIDGGSGYLTELVRPLVGEIESIAPEDALNTPGAAGEFTLLLIDGAIEHLPDSLAARLAEGGRIVCGLMSRGVARLAVGRKAGGAVALHPLAELGFPHLPQFDLPKGWTF